MRQAEKKRKKFYSRIPFVLVPDKKIPKKIAKKIEKIKKTSFRHYFLPKRDEIGRESGKQILLPYAVHTRPGKENSDKNSKKIAKIKKPLSDIFFRQNGMRQAEKERKKFYFRIPFKADQGKKITKKIAKKQRK